MYSSIAFTWKYLNYYENSVFESCSYTALMLFSLFLHSLIVVSSEAFTEMVTENIPERLPNGHFSFDKWSRILFIKISELESAEKWKSMSLGSLNNTSR